ncbi:hypothetical protein [Acidiferrobacter sp. SPIII_3]
MVWVSPNGYSIMRLVDTILMEQKDDWILANCALTLEASAEIAPPSGAA